MSSSGNCCDNRIEVTDERSGDYICINCGLVLDRYFTSGVGAASNDVNQKCVSHTEDKIKDILDKLFVPLSFSDQILTTFEARIMKEPSLSQTSIKKERLLTYCIYESLNELGIPVSFKDVSAVTGISTQDLYSHQEKVILPLYVDLLEKYCSILNIDYKTSTHLRKGLPTKPVTGHNPLTIIGGLLYSNSKTYSLKLTLKQISSVLNISPVSIQRYLAKQKK